MEALGQKLERLLASGGRSLEPLNAKRIAIYGAGGCGQSVAALAQQNGIDVAAFIDARGDGSSGANGIRRFSPTSSEVRELAAEGLAVVVAIFNFATDLRPITSFLSELGFCRVISYPEFHEHFGSADDFWLTKRARYSEWQEEIFAGLELFTDETSRSIYYDVLAHRLNCDQAQLTKPDTENHYLPRDLPPPEKPVRLIDAGAFDGDTLRLFASKGIEFAAVAAFEPDASNYAALLRTAKELNEKLGETILVPCGVGQRTEMLRFESGGGSGSALMVGGTTNIQVVALDEMLPGFKPNYIKLDIEGAEPAALLGAREMIARDRPRLAVCVYHKPEHLWTLPQLMHELNPSYHLALRYHQWNGFDVVAYAY